MGFLQSFVAIWWRIWWWSLNTCCAPGRPAILELENRLYTRVANDLCHTHSLKLACPSGLSCGQSMHGPRCSKILAVMGLSCFCVTCISPVFIMTWQPGFKCLSCRSSAGSTCSYQLQILHASMRGLLKKMACTGGFRGQKSQVGRVRSTC